MLLHQPYDFAKSKGARSLLKTILGEGLLLAEGGKHLAVLFASAESMNKSIDVHRKQKKILSPAFNGPNVNAHLPIFQERAEALCGRIKQLANQATGIWSGDISVWNNRCTLDVIG